MWIDWQLFIFSIIFYSLPIISELCSSHDLAIFDFLYSFYRAYRKKS